MNALNLKRMQTSQCSKASTALPENTLLDETNSSNQYLAKTDFSVRRASAHANAWSCCQVDYNEGDQDDDNWKKQEFLSQYPKQSPTEFSIGQEWSSQENSLAFDFSQRERKNNSIIKQQNEFYEEESVEEQESKQFADIIKAAEARLQKEYEKRKVWKQGFLEKRGGLFSWNSRFCIIKKNKLMYYKRGDIERLRGCIDFQQQGCKITENQQETEFSIICGKKTFKFRGGKKGENIHDWVETIKQIIESQPQKETTQQPLIKSQDQFWRYEQISLQSFLNSTQPLDIVLFRTKCWRAKMLRKLTGSTVDHVGIIVDGGILECIGSKGVSITKFSEIDAKAWSELYERVLIRRLSNKQSKSFKQAKALLPEIVQKVIGCKFGIKLWQIMNGRKQDNISELQQKQFFCSELVAEVLKYTKVCKEETDPSQCLPGCFEQGKKLPLCSGFSYGNELMVNFQN